MDFALRCNNLSCRQRLSDRAIVTTCSHIFCCKCAEGLELSTATGHHRICPACKTPLPNPDDAAETTLRPTEEYKTSVLSGLSPTIIMECTSRGLAFYSYQATQEILYQEYLQKTVDEQHQKTSGQLCQTINDANMEITALQNQVSSLKLECTDLRRKNEEVVDAYKERVAAHGKIQKQFDALKKRLLQSDARGAVDDPSMPLYPQPFRLSDGNVRRASTDVSPSQIFGQHQRLASRKTLSFSPDGLENRSFRGGQRRDARSTAAVGARADFEMDFRRSNLQTGETADSVGCSFVPPNAMRYQSPSANRAPRVSLPRGYDAPHHRKIGRSATTRHVPTDAGGRF